MTRANPTANEYRCGFEGLVSTLDEFAAREGIAAPTEYEVYDEPDGAQVNDSCNPTPDGDLPPHHADQCAGWYYYEADAANRARFGSALTLVALSADGDSANDPHLVAVKAYASYLTQTIGLYPAVWSFHPYEDLSATAYLANGQLAHGDTALLSAYIATLYPAGRRQPTVWLTETAAQLTDPVPTYLGAPQGCDDIGAAEEPPYGMGGCLDGSPKAQAYAASDFLDLARSGSAFPGQITRVYWHQFDSLGGHPTTWDSGLVASGDRYERASYCVLSGESVARALADPACNRVVAAEATEDTARHYPAQGAVGGSTAVDVQARDGAGGAPPPDAEFAACPQPWCSFSLVRLRLTRLGAGYSRGATPRGRATSAAEGGARTRRAGRRSAPAPRPGGAARSRRPGSGSRRVRPRAHGRRPRSPRSGPSPAPTIMCAVPGGQCTKSQARSGRSAPSTIRTASPATTRKSSWSTSR